MIKPLPPTADEKIWLDQKSKLKKLFPFLTDADFITASGKKEMIMNHLQITLGKTKSELETILATL